MKLDERAYRTYQGLILGGLGIFLLSTLGDGRILLYINQRFVLLIAMAAIGFLFLAQAVFKSRPALKKDESGGEGHAEPSFSGAGLWLLALPLLVALLLPQRPLGASAAAVRGVRAGTSFSQNVSEDILALAVPPQERNVLDWMRAFAAVPDPAALDGQPVDATGFVYHDPRMASGQFVLTRFSVTCCVADAAAIGLDVTWAGDTQPADNAWVRVRGKIKIDPADPSKTPNVLAEMVDGVQEPEQPYLFP